MGDHVFQARFTDGQSAKVRDVAIEISEATRELVVFGAGHSPLARAPLSHLRLQGDGLGGGATLTIRRGEERIYILKDSDMALITRLARNLKDRDISTSMWRKIAIWIALAAAALYVTIAFIVPALAGQLAQVINPDAEAAMGRATIRQIEFAMSDGENGDWFCSDPSGVAAMAKLTAQLSLPNDAPFTVRVVRHEMVNAFALPGRQIVFMEGLLEKADHPDMVAGVLAHEMGHVVARDPVEQFMRTAGTAGLLALVFGDATGGTALAFATEAILNAKHSREIEARADEFALARLKHAGIDTNGFADFFDVIAELAGEEADDNRALAWVSSHPPSLDRAARMRDNHGSPLGQASLSETEWAALKTICK